VIQPNYTRPSVPGDICILLESDDPAEIDAVQQRQAGLQQVYAGNAVLPVHQTCQRLEVRSSQALEGLIKRLHAFCERVPVSLPTLTAAALTPLYSGYRQGYILKWDTQDIKELATDEHQRRFAAALEQAIQGEGITMLYPAGWVSTLITALEGISPPEQDEPRLLDQTYPLFTPRLLSVSRLVQKPVGNASIKTAIGYQLLAKIPLKTNGHR